MLQIEQIMKMTFNQGMYSISVTRQLIERDLIKATLDQTIKGKIYNKALQSHLDFLCKKESLFCSFYKYLRLENLNFHRTS